MKQSWTVLFACSVAATCASPTSSPEASTTQAASEAPADAPMISNEDFDTMLAAGELTRPAEASSALARFTASVAALNALPDEARARHAALLHEASRHPAPLEAPQMVSVSGETRELKSLAGRVNAAARRTRLRQDPAQLHAHYAALYAAAPGPLRTSWRHPDELRTAAPETLRAELAAVDAALTPVVPDLERTRLADLGTANALMPGNGRDSDGTCRPTELAARFQFPLARFTPPIRNQGRRGSCWAFAYTGALETRDRVQLGVASDVSEQFMINQVKARWSPDDFVDGYTYGALIDDLFDHEQELPSEPYWTYNPSYQRPTEFGTSDKRAFRDSCANYSGSCSDTAHQSQWVCTNRDGERDCGYEVVRFPYAGVMPARDVLLWESGDPFQLSGYRALLAAGHALIGDLDVHLGMQEPLLGYVTDPRMVHRDANGYERDGAAGGHEVVIVGFVDNDTMRAAQTMGKFQPRTALPESGGYFIIRNSWGCNWGDGGYFYASPEYVREHFVSLAALAMSSDRSEPWRAAHEPKQPVFDSPRGSDLTVDLRVNSHLGTFIVPNEGYANQADIQVQSDQPGDLVTVAPMFSAARVYGTFASEGIRHVKVRARYQDWTLTQHYTVNVVNAAPEIKLVGPSVAYALDHTWVTVEITDKNETDRAALCAAARWHFRAPAWPFSNEGCRVKVAFGEGETANTFTVVATDQEGLVTTATFTLPLLPRRESPYPNITDGGLLRTARQISRGCTLARDIALGSHINLDVPAHLACDGNSTRPQLAHVSVETADDSPLTFEWQLWAIDPTNVVAQARTARAEWQLPRAAFGYTPNATHACGVTVRTITRDGRVRFFDVWRGQCTFAAHQLG